MTHLERLKEWAKLMRSVPKDRLDMKTWTCGTEACAAGHAAQHPPFMEEGFSLAREHPYAGAPSYKAYRNYHAIEEFFGLSTSESHRICAYSAYDHDFSEGMFSVIAPEDVVLHIETIIRKKETQNDQAGTTQGVG